MWVIAASLRRYEHVEGESYVLQCVFNFLKNHQTDLAPGPFVFEQGFFFGVFWLFEKPLSIELDDELISQIIYCFELVDC